MKEMTNEIARQWAEEAVCDDGSILPYELWLKFCKNEYSNVTREHYNIYCKRFTQYKKELKRKGLLSDDIREYEREE